MKKNFFKRLYEYRELLKTNLKKDDTIDIKFDNTITSFKL